MPLLRVLLVLTLFVLSTPARAEINSEGAEQLKSIFNNFITYQKTLSGIPGAAKLECDGEVMVEQAGTYYAVTLPHARLIYPNGGRLDFGMVSINASPGDKEGQWKMAVAIPTPILLLDVGQDTVLKISLGAQKAAGIWDEKLENFSKLDAEYKNIKAESPQNKFSLVIPETKIQYDFTAQDDSTWSGPGSFAAKGFSVKTEAGEGDISIDELRCDFSMDRYNPDALKKYKEQVKTLEEDFSKADPSKRQQTSKQMAFALSDLFLAFANGFKASYTAQGIHVQSNAPEQSVIKIDRAYLSSDFSEISGSSALISLQLGYGGFSINPVPAGYEGIFPSDLNLDFKFENIPLHEILEDAKSTVQASEASPEMAPLAEIFLMSQLPTRLLESQAKIRVVNNHIGNNVYSFDLNGLAEATTYTTGNIHASATGTFRGLDPLLEKVKALAEKPDTKDAKTMQSLASLLENIKEQGRLEQEASGPAYTYDFELTPQGQILINEKPLIPASPAYKISPEAPPQEQPQKQSSP